MWPYPNDVVIGSKAMIEVVSALLAFFSISMFLANAVDAYRARG
jgi:hypothetical protein